MIMALFMCWMLQRSVTVAGTLLSKEQKPEFLSRYQNRIHKLAEDFA